MCQPQSQGGKRCLRHSAASNAEVRYTWAKTGVDRETIYGILKDLNKEGRKLEAPQLEEVKEFLRKEEFKTKLDPDLNERDRKLILKNLKKAEEEAEKQGVTAGAFHAYKNLFARTMDRIKKPLAALGLGGVLIASLAGCGGSINNTNHTPEPTASTQPVACSTLTAQQVKELGDVIPAQEVTDSYGKYCKVTINPDSGALKYDPSKVDMAALKANGFTEKDAQEAQKHAVNFLVNQTLDSSRLDNYSQSPAQWLDDNSSLITPTFVKGSKITASKNGMAGTGIIVSDNLPEPIVRNGGPRAHSTSVEVTGITAQKSAIGNESIVVVRTAATVVYDVTNKQVVDMYLKNNPGQTKATLQASHPQLFQDGNTQLVLMGNFAYGYDAGNYKQIGGASDNYKISTSDGTTISDYRKS